MSLSVLGLNNTQNQPIILNPTINYNYARFPNVYALVLLPNNSAYVIEDVINIRIVNNNYFEADTFELTFMLSTQKPGFGLAYWSSVPYVIVEMRASLTAVPVQDANSRAAVPRWFVGKSDRISVDLIQGTVTLHGRDLTSLFIDSQLSIKPSGDAYSFFQQVGTYFGFTNNTMHIDQSLKSISLDTLSTKQYFTKRYASAWDVLTYIVNALPDPYYIYVEQYYFVVVPIAQVQQTTYMLYWSEPSQQYRSPIANIEELTVERDFVLSQTVSVLVYAPVAGDPLHPIMGQATGTPVVVAQNPNTPGATTQPSNNPGTPAQNINSPRSVRTYVYSAPGVTAEVAQTMAQAYLDQITQHAHTLRARMPGDFTIQPYGTVTLSGTNSAWDNIYYVHSIEWTYNMEDGIVMEIDAKTTPALSIQTTVPGVTQ